MRTRQIIFAILFLFLPSVFLLAQASFQAEGFPREKMPPSHGGPWNQDLDLYESPDGIHFTRRGVFVQAAGVPNLLRVEGKLYAVFQWFPFKRIEAFDKIAIVMSHDGGKTWTDPEPIEMKGMPKIIRRAFDPTLVSTGNGSFRLYFASDRIKAGRMFGPGNRAIFSAISKDALHYQFEPGERFGFEDRETYDPTSVYFKGKWHLICPESDWQGTAYHAVSVDGLRFDQWEKVSVPEAVTWIGNMIVFGNKLRFYGSGHGGVWLADSAGGSQWELHPSLDLRGGDPAVVQLPNETFLALVTSEPRRNDAAPDLPPDHFD